MTQADSPIGQVVGADRCVSMKNDHGSGGCEKGYYLSDCFGLRILNREGFFPDYDAFIEQTKNIWSAFLDIRKRFEPKAEEFAKKYALAPYTMFIGSGALWGETILFSMCILEEMQWKHAISLQPISSMERLSLWNPVYPWFSSKARTSVVRWTNVSRSSL